MRVYLAGPDVFLPSPLERAALLKDVCARHGLVGVSPLDTPGYAAAGHDTAAHPAADLAEPFRIAHCNEAHIRSSQALIANLTPFRGPSADAGTVFELGFMRALGRPVFGWTNDHVPFAARTRAAVGAAPASDGGFRDAHGMALEDFGLHDNLMIDGAIVLSGGVLIARDVAAEQRWRDLEAFERCVAAVAARLLRRP